MHEAEYARDKYIPSAQSFSLDHQFVEQHPDTRPLTYIFKIASTFQICPQSFTLKIKMKVSVLNEDVNGFGGNTETATHDIIENISGNSQTIGSANINGGINGTKGVSSMNGMNVSHAEGRQEPYNAPSPIAIVGMGMRLPGGVSDSSAFWYLLIKNKDGRCLVPGDRYNVDAFYSPSGKPGTVRSQYGYFLEDADLRNLDAAFFSMNKREVEKLDPQQRILLEVVWECMENGGQTGWRGKNIGCYVGVFGEDWLDLAAKDVQHHGMYRITGSGDFAIANRVSYEYNLRGPRY